MKARTKRFFDEHKEVITLIALFLAVKLFFVIRVHNVIWDESVYLGMGKYIYSLGTVGVWEVARPLLLPFLLGIGWKLHLNYILFAEIVALLFSTGCAVAVYLIGRELFNKTTALIAGFILLITPIFFLYSNYILTEIPSTFFVLLAVYFIIKKRYVLAGLFCALASITRLPQGLIVIVVLVLFGLRWIIKKKFPRESVYFTLSFVVFMLPFLLLNYFMYSRKSSDFFGVIFAPWIEGSVAQGNPADSIVVSSVSSFLYNIFYYLINMSKENAFLWLFVVGIVIFCIKKDKKDSIKSKAGVILLALLIYLFYYSTISNKQARFYITFLPFMCLFCAYGFFELAKRKNVYVKAALLLLFVVISTNVMYKDLLFLNYRTTYEPNVVREYYRYFADKNVEGPILTTDPVHVAYADALFEPFYFSVDKASKLYEQHKDKAYAVIYSKSSFFCAETDIKCIAALDALDKKIREENEPVFSKNYRGNDYYIYLRT